MPLDVIVVPSDFDFDVVTYLGERKVWRGGSYPWPKGWPTRDAKGFWDPPCILYSAAVWCIVIKFGLATHLWVFNLTLMEWARLGGGAVFRSVIHSYSVWCRIITYLEKQSFV